MRFYLAAASVFAFIDTGPGLRHQQKPETTSTLLLHVYRFLTTISASHQTPQSSTIGAFNSVKAEVRVLQFVAHLSFIFIRAQWSCHWRCFGMPRG